MRERIERRYVYGRSRVYLLDKCIKCKRFSNVDECIARIDWSWPAQEDHYISESNLNKAKSKELRIMLENAKVAIFKGNDEIGIKLGICPECVIKIINETGDKKPYEGVDV